MRRPTLQKLRVLILILDEYWRHGIAIRAKDDATCSHGARSPPRHGSRDDPCEAQCAASAVAAREERERGSTGRTPAGNRDTLKVARCGSLCAPNAESTATVKRSVPEGIR